jgi:hypothetical protein
MKELLGFLTRISLVLLVGSIPVAVRLFLPLRHHDGTWRVTRSSLEPWTYEWEDARKGAQVRDYIWGGVDWVQRREYDWEGDGVYDCHEDDCDKRSTRVASCVFHRQGWRWIAAPPEVTECLPGHALQASR